MHCGYEFTTRDWYVKFTNALSHIEYQEYDGRSGALVRHEDPNGVETEWTVDAFGRTTIETRSDGSETYIARGWCTTSTCDGDSEGLKVLVATDGAPTQATIVDQ